MSQPEVLAQLKEKRIRNFNEVSLGYPKRLALEEAKRCPQCADPVCMGGCPLGINIPTFIRMLRENDTAGAYEVIRKENPFPAICGRICSAPCEIACVLNDEKAPIGIRALERYSADGTRQKSAKWAKGNSRGQRISIVGSGPAGLSAASSLALGGYQVTIFESMDQAGGVLRYGIPEFRIPRKNLDLEIQSIQALGVQIETKVLVGQTLTVEEIFEQGFVALLITTGAGGVKFMPLVGENLGGVYYAEEFLMRMNLNQGVHPTKSSAAGILGQRIAVIGSGNTALDCARACVRFGKDVTLIFRRTEDEMRVASLEQHYAQEEGIRFEPLVKPLAVLPNENNFVSGLKCIRMDFVEAETSQKWDIEPVPDSEFVLDVDTVIIAIGHKPNSLIARKIPQLKCNRDGTIKVDAKTGMTTIKNVFAAGNVVSNAGPIVEAIASGKEAARRIDQHIKDT